MEQLLQDQCKTKDPAWKTLFSLNPFLIEGETEGSQHFAHLDAQDGLLVFSKLTQSVKHQSEPSALPIIDKDAFPIAAK